MKRISFKVGDLFAIPLSDGKYVTGRILLYPKKQKFKKIYELLNLSLDEPYYKFAFRHGLDLARFFKTKV